MKIIPLRDDLVKFLRKRGLVEKFSKQAKLFEENIFHPSLETEILNPKHLKIWSFRIDKKYRVIFIFFSKDLVEIIDINNHYQK